MIDYVALYVKLVNGGLPINKVPEKWRKQVEKSLNN